MGAVTRQPGTPGQAGVGGQEQHKKLSRAETGQATQGTEGQEGPRHPAPSLPMLQEGGLGSGALPPACCPGELVTPTSRTMALEMGLVSCF